MEKIVSIPPATGKGKLLDRVRAVARFKHYSLRTERKQVIGVRSPLDQVL